MKENLPTFIISLVLATAAIIPDAMQTDWTGLSRQEEIKQEQAYTITVEEAEEEEPAEPSIGIGRHDKVEHNEPALFVSEAGYKAYEYELEYVARLVYLEARGEPVSCQRAVTEVIFNRLASGLWGDSLTEVIYADGEFEPAAYIAESETTDEIRAIVYDVFWNGSSIPERVLFFRADYYHQWTGAVDEFAIGSTYFSSSEWCG